MNKYVHLFFLSVSPPPPPSQFSNGTNIRIDEYGFTTGLDEFNGRGLVGFTTWYHPTYPYAVVQLQLNQESVAVSNEFFAFSLLNESRSMFFYSPEIYLEHTQKKPIKRSNFRYISEIASSAYYGGKATLSSPTTQQYTFPNEIPTNTSDNYTFRGQLIYLSNLTFYYYIKDRH